MTRPVWIVVADEDGVPQEVVELRTVKSVDLVVEHRRAPHPPRVL